MGAAADDKDVVGGREHLGRFFFFAPDPGTVRRKQRLCDACLAEAAVEPAIGAEGEKEVAPRLTVVGGGYGEDLAAADREVTDLGVSSAAEQRRAASSKGTIQLPIGVQPDQHARLAATVVLVPARRAPARRILPLPSTAIVPTSHSRPRPGVTIAIPALPNERSSLPSGR